MKIRGPATATRDHVLTQLGQFGPHPRFASEMVPALWAAAERYGIDPVVMVAQAGHETGWGHYGGLVPPGFHNTAGIKLRDLSGFPNSEVTAAHAVFPDWATGARAHAQHLMAYTQTAVSDPIVDPRWVWVYGRKPPIVDVEGLSGNWAPSSTYGQRVAATAAKLQEGASMVALMPGFTWVGGPKAGGTGSYSGVPWRICLHTTETPPISRGGNPAYMAATHRTPPHIWYDWEADQGWQSVDLNYAAAALWSDGDPTTNRANCLQVELIGYASEAETWPDVALQRIAARVVKPLVDFVGGNIDLSDAAVPLPGAIPGSASEYAPQRLSPHQWLYGPIGLVGHRHVPDNDHWDPGGLNTRRIRDLVLAGGGGTTPPPEEDLTPEQNHMLTHLYNIFNDGDRWAHWYNSSMAGRSAAGQISFVQDPRNGAIYLVHGTAWKWWMKDGNILSGFQNHWAGLGANSAITAWDPTHIDAIPSADLLVDSVADLKKMVGELRALAQGELSPPITEKVVDVEGSIKAATIAQLAKRGAADLFAALGIALGTSPAAAMAALAASSDVHASTDDVPVLPLPDHPG